MRPLAFSPQPETSERSQGHEGRGATAGKALENLTLHIKDFHTSNIPEPVKSLAKNTMTGCAHALGGLPVYGEMRPVNAPQSQGITMNGSSTAAGSCHVPSPHWDGYEAAGTTRGRRSRRCRSLSWTRTEHRSPSL
jgi:hypothetical protein